MKRTFLPREPGREDGCSSGWMLGHGVEDWDWEGVESDAGEQAIVATAKRGKSRSQKCSIRGPSVSLILGDGNESAVRVSKIFRSIQRKVRLSCSDNLRALRRGTRPPVLETGRRRGRWRLVGVVKAGATSFVYDIWTYLGRRARLSQPKRSGDRSISEDYDRIDVESDA